MNMNEGEVVLLCGIMLNKGQFNYIRNSMFDPSKLDIIMKDPTRYTIGIFNSKHTYLDKLDGPFFIGNCIDTISDEDLFTEILYEDIKHCLLVEDMNVLINDLLEINYLTQKDIKLFQFLWYY